MYPQDERRKSIRSQARKTMISPMIIHFKDSFALFFISGFPAEVINKRPVMIIASKETTAASSIRKFITLFKIKMRWQNSQGAVSFQWVLGLSIVLPQGTIPLQASRLVAMQELLKFPSVDLQTSRVHSLLSRSHGAGSSL